MRSTFSPGKLLAAFALVSLLGGCKGTPESTFVYSDSLKVNQTQMGNKCHDAAVLLDVEPGRAKDIGLKVLKALSTKISINKEMEIGGQRQRSVGVFVGSGGEELLIKLQAVSNKQTFVTATTVTGFVGGAGQKAWSCQIVDEMVKMAK